jgi:hypothetical protein
MSIVTNLQDLCKQILSLDKDIRFVGIETACGRIASFQYRQGIIPLLTREESELSFMQALIRMDSRRTLEYRIGKPLFSITEYEQVIRSTVMVYDENNRFQLGSEFVLFLSFDKKCTNPMPIIKKKLLPLIGQIICKR